MEFKSIKANELSLEEKKHWHTLQLDNEYLASPYFNLEYTELVASVRNDVRILVIYKREEPIGFFPYQITAQNNMIPLSGSLSDNHGLIASSHFNFNFNEILSKLKLKSFSYDHFINAQQHYLSSPISQDVSPIIDLSKGYDNYLLDLKKMKSKMPYKLRKAYRKLSNENK